GELGSSTAASDMAGSFRGVSNRIQRDVVGVSVACLVADDYSDADALSDRLRCLFDDSLLDVDAVGDAIFTIQICIIAPSRHRYRKQLVYIVIGQTIAIEKKPDCFCTHFSFLRGGRSPVPGFLVLLHTLLMQCSGSDKITSRPVATFVIYRPGEVKQRQQT